MTEEKSSNSVIALISEEINSLEQLVEWISFDGRPCRLYRYEERPRRPCPLNRITFSRGILLPVPKTYKKNALELVQDCIRLAREHPKEFEIPENRHKIWIVREFVQELVRWYPHYLEVQELLQIPIIRNLIAIQN